MSRYEPNHEKIPASLSLSSEVYADWLMQGLRAVFPEAWPDAGFVQQAAAQLPWSTNLVPLTRLKNMQICARDACTIKKQFHRVYMP
ncbi:MAG: hypothetical protein ACOH2K_03560 [Burkholderiaceae bacterium]